MSPCASYAAAKGVAAVPAAAAVRYTDSAPATGTALTADVHPWVIPGFFSAT